MRIFDIFIKKENKFLRLLNELTARSSEASELLVEFMNIPTIGEERAKIHARIKQKEVEGDDIYAEIFDELNTTFITPFDREDIQELAAKLDDVLDFILGISKRVMMYNVDAIPDTFKILSMIVKEQCDSLKIAMSHLGKVTKSPQIVKDECTKIHQLETKADEIYAQYQTKLFREADDPILLIKLSQLAQYLENATDVTEDVADVIRTIIVKYN